MRKLQNDAEPLVNQLSRAAAATSRNQSNQRPSSRATARRSGIAGSTVNGQTISPLQISNPICARNSNARRQDRRRTPSVLDLQINTTLLEMEAQKASHRHSSFVRTRSKQSRAAITPAQIKKFIDENKDQFEGVDPNVANKQVAAYLHDEAESKLATIS
jgi:hypothetical protein